MKCALRPSPQRDGKRNPVSDLCAIALELGTRNWVFLRPIWSGLDTEIPSSALRW
ncbi:MAG: hypothetical protein EBE86_020380 [Hormoscilla sp. GUM202]|nr:hypothetical protein [Hormoscilla sp. GM7CHS1pb]MBO1349581.1 hypothetical protein [Hormoscilla sp. GUM202]